MLEMIPLKQAHTRGKAKRNTEAFAAMNKLPLIKLETLYDAKAYFSQ